MRPRAWATYEQAGPPDLAPASGRCRWRGCARRMWTDGCAHCAGKGTSAPDDPVRAHRAPGRTQSGAQVGDGQPERGRARRPATAYRQRDQPLIPVQARALLDAAKTSSARRAAVDRDRARVAARRGLGPALARRGLRGRDTERAAGDGTQRRRQRGQATARRVERRAIRTQIAAAPKRSAERRQLREQLEGPPRRMAESADRAQHDGTEVGAQPSHDPHAGDRGDRVEGAPSAPARRTARCRRRMGGQRAACSRRRSARRSTRGT